MYSSELVDCLNAIPNIKKLFLGVYSCDKLPKTRRKHFALIVNTDTSDKPGVHWQVIYVRGETAYFFCSLSNRMNTFVRKYLSKYKRIYVNTFKSQNNLEYTCGGYAIFMIMMLFYGNSFKSLCDFFKIMKNDDLFIRYFMRELFNYEIPVIV